VRERVRIGEPTIGSFIGLGSPNVAEMMAHAGFDWLVVETEHNALDTAEIQHMLMAMSGTNVVPIVRLPSMNPVYIQRALDIGAMGIVVPLVRTAAEARAVVAATRYPPQGVRSFGALRASHYTYDNDDYFARANDHLLVVFIIETREALENLDEIAAVDGVDVLFIGPADLSIALGESPLNPASAALDAAVERVLEVGRRHGVAVGKGGSTPDDLRSMQAQGFTWLAYGPDYFLLRAAIAAGIQAFSRSRA
jgi:4-hydroxy-2-oxoheptanedioate aldolase